MRTRVSLLFIVIVSLASHAARGVTLTLETAQPWSFSDTTVNDGFNTLGTVFAPRDDDVLTANFLDPSLHVLTNVRVGFTLDVSTSGFTVINPPAFVGLFTSINFTDAVGTTPTAGVNTLKFVVSGATISINGWNALRPVNDISLYDNGSVILTPSIDTSMSNVSSFGTVDYTGQFRVEYTWEVIPTPGAMSVMALAGVAAMRRRRG
jgi:hypothetical protein